MCVNSKSGSKAGIGKVQIDQRYIATGGEQDDDIFILPLSAKKSIRWNYITFCCNFNVIIEIEGAIIGNRCK